MIAMTQEANMNDIQVTTINHKRQKLHLNSGQELAIAIENMFDVNIYDGEQKIGQLRFQPLSSLNNPEISPVYKMTRSSILSQKLQHSPDAEVVSKMAMALYCQYTNGRVQNPNFKE